jgi:SAM-dependent methyltransferase
VTPAEPALHSGRGLTRRYTTSDLDVLTAEEARRFVSDGGDPQRDPPLAWELLYRREPQLYDRLVSAERLHPEVPAWLPDGVERIVEVGAGTGRLTLELVRRAREVVAIEPASTLREILREKLAQAAGGGRARVAGGFFDDLPLPSDHAELVVACSAFTPAPGHGGDAGLREMERVCRPGGCVAIVWPNQLDWLARRGYRHVSFPGAMAMEFASHEDAVELVEIFYPHASAAVRRGGSRRVPYETIGINPPRDIAFKVMPA